MKFIRNENLVSVDVDGETVMMSVETGAYYGLTGAGPRIWEALASERTADEIVADLLERYDASAEQLRLDVDEFLADMLEGGLVKQV